MALCPYKGISPQPRTDTSLLPRRQFSAMATSYKALMALGESHTKSVESTVQAVLAEKKQKEQQRRKQQELQERKERELEAKMRLRHFEEQKRKAELEAKRAEERKAKEADLLRREAEQRDALRYGPKKAKSAAGKWPTSSSGVHDEVRKKRLPDDDDDDMGIALTREEKRERKLQAELKRAFHSPRRVNSATGAYRKPGGRLPGGAYDVATSSADKATATSGPGNVKDRLTKMPNTLTRLNVVKRDTRTIDEIVRDRRENKEVLNGDQARGFDDWFTPSSRTQPKKEKAPVPSSSASSSSSRPSSQPMPPPAARRSAAPVATPKPRPKASAPAPASSSAKKRPRSLSDSRSSTPPPAKRSHMASASSSKSMKPIKSTSRSRSPLNDDESRLSETIWGIFGKNKATYAARDVLSDSEDDDEMEAGASALEWEEKISERTARKEDREAEIEERRHEEDKRRRKAMSSRG
ncbi:hypothetical protein C8F04DRAFT_298958 [Mycena alexandri]|uniref:SPT2 chromatin protein n=1 Tax=Mycena alexandri TaxID=1745969 RepID=A0AAD6T779_9AGAR|nr:hypothetical protein C8F04DRAFT_298958 [Mycena alexandri]